MTSPLFNTHAYIKRLQLAGLNEQQAEVQSELQVEVFESVINNKLITKEDFLHFEHAQKQNFADVHNEFTAVRNEMASGFSAVERKFVYIEGKFTLLNWMVSFLLAGMATMLFKVLPHIYNLENLVAKEQQTIFFKNPNR